MASLPLLLLALDPNTSCASIFCWSRVPEPDPALHDLQASKSSAWMEVEAGESPMSSNQSMKSPMPQHFEMFEHPSAIAGHASKHLSAVENVAVPERHRNRRDDPIESIVAPAVPKLGK